MDVVGDRWSILLLREAYYGTRRFDEFQYYLGVAPNILSTRLKKFVDLGMMTRVPLPEHGGRYEYLLTKKGRDFFPTYLALKKWGDDLLAEPEGPQVVFKDRISGRPVEYAPLHRGTWGTHMKRLVVAAAVSLTLVPMGALAQERGGDAALGALSGAVVFGPVGAVAGALVGYTAGPSIARSWGLRGSSRRDGQSRVKSRAAAPRAPNPQVVQNGPAASASPPPVQTPAAPPRVQARAAPPVQTLE